MLPLRSTTAHAARSSRKEEEEELVRRSASQDHWERMPMTPQPEPPLDWKRPVLMACLFLLALLAYTSWSSAVLNVKLGPKAGNEVVVPTRAEENVDVCAGPAGDRFLVPIAIGEQESRAQLHLIQLAHHSVALNRTLVLPRAYASRFSSCGHQSFDFFYAVPPFLQLFERLGGYAVVQRDFEKWLLRQDGRRTGQRVRLQIEGQYGSISTDGALELDPLAAAADDKQSCLLEAKLDFEGRERLWSDVLLVDYNLRNAIFDSTVHVDIDTSFKYQHEWYELAGRVLEAAGPAIGVHWRTENIEPETLEGCGTGLVDAILALKASDPALEAVYFATDYPLEMLSGAPSNTGHQGRLDQDEWIVAHSDTLTQSLTPAHRAAMSSFLQAFDTLVSPHGLKLSTYRSLIRSLSPSLPPSLAAWAANPAAPAIVSMLVLRQTDYFLAGLPKSKRMKALGKTACARDSSWTNRVSRARAKTWHEQHGVGGTTEQEGRAARELKNVVGRWRTDGKLE